MPGKPLVPGIRTVRINFSVPDTEAQDMREHARRAGDEGNVSRMLRRLVRDDIRRFERTNKGPK